MNRLIICILTIVFPFRLSGQEFLYSDHYVNNSLAINPAFAGCHDALSTTIQYRNQWVGFKSAPKNYQLSAHTPAFNDKIGLGLFLEENIVGIQKETNIIGNYAYRMELRDGKLALGLGMGVVVYNVGWNELDVVDEDDKLLINNSKSTVLPTLSVGAYYYTKKYFVGISLPQFLSREWDESTGDYKLKNDFSKYSYFFTGGYEVEINSQVKLIPSMLIEYHANNVIGINYNAQINLKDKIWMGIGYRNKNMLVGMLQCQPLYQLRVAYSYDFNFGKIGKYTNGSHEVAIYYTFRYTRKVMSPRNY